jgi:hypothetical protein
VSGDRVYRPGELGARFPFAGDLIERARETAAAGAEPEADLTGRTWLEAATAIPDRGWRVARWPAGAAQVLAAAAPRPPYARVYRTTAGPELGGPRWYWHCPTCDMGGGHNCLHDVLHPPGTWASAMCGAFHHVHTRHPRPPATPNTAEHTTLFGRRRCDWSRPTERELQLASWTLCGRTGMPRGPEAREFAREVLALAGRRTP